MSKKATSCVSTSSKEFKALSKKYNISSGDLELAMKLLPDAGNNMSYDELDSYIGGYFKFTSTIPYKSKREFDKAIELYDLRYNSDRKTIGRAVNPKFFDMDKEPSKGVQEGLRELSKVGKIVNIRPLTKEESEEENGIGSDAVIEFSSGESLELSFSVGSMALNGNKAYSLFKALGREIDNPFHKGEKTIDTKNSSRIYFAAVRLAYDYFVGHPEKLEALNIDGNPLSDLNKKVRGKDYDPSKDDFAKNFVSPFIESPSNKKISDSEAHKLYKDAVTVFGKENVRLFKDISDNWQVNVAKPVYQQKETSTSKEVAVKSVPKEYTEVESFTDGRLASTDKNGNISIKKDFTLEEFFNYVSGKVKSPTSLQKKEMFRQLEGWKVELSDGTVMNLGLNTLKKVIKTVEDAKQFLYLHEMSHKENNDVSVYWKSGKDLMSQDKIDIEARATRDAYEGIFGDRAIRIFNPLLESETLVAKIKEDSKEHITFDPETHTYYLDGNKVDMSVTQFVHQDETIPEAWKLPSSAIGISLDRAVRLYFQDKDILKENIPNMTRQDIINLKEDLDKLKKALDKQFKGKAYRVVTDEFPIAGTYSYIGKEGKTHKMTIAGTMDMLIYDSDGNFYIYDVKTKRINNSKVWNEETKKGYYRQLSMYKAILEANYPELRGKIKDMKLVRFDVAYPAPIGDGVGNGEVYYESYGENLYYAEDADERMVPIQSSEGYSAPRLSMVEDSGLFNVEPQQLEGEFSSFESLSQEDKDALEEELGEAEKPQDIPQDEQSKQVIALYNPGVVPATERMFLANSAMYYASFIISQLQSSPEANSAYFGNEFAGIDFTSMSRRDIIDEIGISRILNYVKEAYFNPDNRDDIDDFGTLDKLQVAYDNWGALIKSSYSKLITLEDTTVVPATPDEIKKEDLLEDIEDTVEGATLEEKDREYWQIGQRQISARASLSIEIKRAFEKLPVVDSEGNYIMDKYGYGLMTFVDSGEAINKILDWVKDCTSIEEMETVLQDMSASNPWLNNILGRIKEEPFRSMFYQNFRKQFTQYSIVTVGRDSNGNRTYDVHIINTKEADRAILDDVVAAFNNGLLKNLIIPLKGSLDGKGKVNEESVQSIKESAQRILKRLQDAHTDGKMKSALSKEIPNISKILNTLGIHSDTKVLAETFAKDHRMKNASSTNSFKIINEIIYLTSTLLDHKEAMDYNPVEKGADGNVYGNYRNIVKIMSNFIQDSIESSTYENGKMYYSFVTPSYMGKLVSNLKDSLDNPDKFNKFMQSEYGRYRFFKDGNDWKNVWLEQLNNSSEARQKFDYKVQLSYDGTSYTDLSELGYTLSLMQEYFYDTSTKERKLAWYRVPILANKPSSEFVRFTRYSGKNYKRYIKNGLKKVFDQELMRIKTVLERSANPNINKIGVKEKVTFDLKDSMLSKSLKSKIVDSKGRIRPKMLLTLNDFVKNGKLAFHGSGAEFKFLDALNNELIEKTELGQMIVDKINGNSVDEESFNRLFDEAIDSYMDIIVDNQRKEWEDLGLYDTETKEVERINKETGKTETVKETSFKYINNIGKTRIEADKALEEYIWNDMFATINIIELTATDLAYYKNVEDFQKRYAQIHSPAMRLNISAKDSNGVLYSADGYERTIYLKDCIEKSDIVNNVRKAFDNKIAQLSGIEKNHMKMMRDLIVKEFNDINVADAQGYSSPTSYRKKMGMMGKWTPEMEEAYTRIRSGNYNVNDLGVVWQPIKPFVYSQIPKSSGASTMSELKVPVQNKNSEYMLFLADAIMRGDNQNNKLIAIFDFMEDSAYDGRVSKNGKVIKEGTYNGIGIDTVQFESAVNSGSMGAIDINSLDSYDKIKKALYDKVYYNADKSETSDNAMDRYNDQYVHTISFEDYGIQQEVPAHLVDHQQLMGSQMRILSISDITPNTDFEVDGEIIKDSELKEEYQQLIAENIRESYNYLIKEFKLKGTRKQKNEALSRLLTKTILEDQRYGSDLLRACSLDKNGEFIVPPNDPVQSIRIQQLLNSIIKNRINKQKISGGPVVQASAFGLSEDLHIVFNEKDPGKVKYFECYMPIPSRELEEALTKPDGTLMDIDEAEKAGIITEDMRKAIGYRIPTEDKYSMAPLYIKGFLPKAAGEAIMLPKEITKLSGSDFDIDKMYVMLKSCKVQSRTDWRLFRNDMMNSFKRHRPKATAEEKRIFKDRLGIAISEIINGNIEFSEGSFEMEVFDYLSENSDRYKTKVFEISTGNNREGRNNRIFDLQWAVLTNADTAVKMFNPGSFDVQKKAARIINILKSGSGHSYEELSEMSLEELDELLESGVNRNIVFSGTQVYFHKQNMTAGKLIGVFANNNTSHAFLSMQDISLNLPEGEGFMFDGISVNGVQNNKLDSMYGKDGALISKTIAGFLAASVDAVKDPVLNYINLNTFTANTAMLLARLGFDTDSIGLFLTQPIIEKVTREYFKRSNEGYVTVDEVINSFLPDDYKLVESMKKSLETTPFTKEDLAEGIMDRNTDSDFQMSVLLLFQKLAGMAQDLNTLTFLTKFNSVTNAVGPTIADTLVMRERYNKFLDKMETEPPFSNNAKYVIENSPILEAFYDTTVSDRGASKLIFQEHFPHYNEMFSVIVENLRRSVKGQLDAKTLNKLVNDFMVYKLTLGRNPVIDGSEDSRRRFINNFIEEFSRESAGITDNDLLSIIKVRARDSRCPVSTLEARTGGYNIDLQERIKSSWSDLVLNPSTQKLGTDLFFYNIFRSGFGFSPKSFGHMASVDVKMNIPRYIETIRNIDFNDSEVSVMDFLYQFLRNHTQDYKLVPRMEDSDKVTVSKQSNVKGDKMITFAYDKKLRGMDTIIVEKSAGKATFAPVIMYQDKVYMNPVDTGSSVIYTETTPLGNPNNFLEYGPEGAYMKSVLANPVSPERENTGGGAKKDTPEEPQYKRTLNINKLNAKIESADEEFWNKFKKVYSSESDRGRAIMMDRFVDAVLTEMGVDPSNKAFREKVKEKTIDKIKSLC